MTRFIAFMVLASFVLGVLMLMFMQHKPQPMFPLVESAVHANPQCAVPAIDYSKKPRRFDSKAIA